MYNLFNRKLSCYYLDKLQKCASIVIYLTDGPTSIRFVCQNKKIITK